MFEKLSALGKQLLLKTLPDILNGNLSPRPQDESKVTFSPNITREQEAIDWNKTAEEIDNQVRGMRPWPIAFTTYEQTRWKLLNVEALAEKTTAEPGTIIKKIRKICGLLVVNKRCWQSKNYSQQVKENKRSMSF